jgi:hypothetical protein
VSFRRADEATRNARAAGLLPGYLRTVAIRWLAHCQGDQAAELTNPSWLIARRAEEGVPPLEGTGMGQDHYLFEELLEAHQQWVAEETALGMTAEDGLAPAGCEGEDRGEPARLSGGRDPPSVELPY